MAAIDFPNSPTNGQIFTSGGMSWTYVAGVGWTINNAIVEAGSGFTFIADTMPLPVNVGDTWFDSSTGASGGTSWVAIEEGPAGASEKVWVQFAPGVGGAPMRGYWGLATQTAGQAIAAAAITTVSWATPVTGNIVYEPPAIGTLAWVIPRRGTYSVSFQIQANIGTIDRARINFMTQYAMDTACAGGSGCITIVRGFDPGDKLQMQTYNTGAAGQITWARVEIRELGPIEGGLYI
jgi:hypothetical protein